MLDLYYWPTPNGHKITLLLEELAEAGAPQPYRIVPVDIGKGEQFEPGFLAVSPNNKMPALVDHAPAGGGAPLSIFESGAILLYLAEKSGRFLPTDLHARYEALQWLFWQAGGLGPMTGQHGHFSAYAPEPVPYAIERYRREAERLLGVLDRQLQRSHLQGRDFIAGDYGIADIACYPWIDPYKAAPLDLAPFAAVRRWRDAIAARPATQRAYALAKRVNPDTGKPLTDAEKQILFGRKP
jgi:GST-like protein